MRFISSSVPFFRLRSVRRQGRWNAFELNTQRRDEKSEEEEAQKTIAVVDLADKMISCVCSMRACV
mgnify:CR=1 FL=1